VFINRQNEIDTKMWADTLYPADIYPPVILTVGVATESTYNVEDSRGGTVKLRTSFVPRRTIIDQSGEDPRRYRGGISSYRGGYRDGKPW
jgi:hypothetical protein